MALYRFYWINASDQVRAALNIECESDEKARMVAVCRQGEYAAVEVWIDRRFVARIGAAANVESS